jgi:hypothetical protein
MPHWHSRLVKMTCAVACWDWMAIQALTPDQPLV